MIDFFSTKRTLKQNILWIVLRVDKIFLHLQYKSNDKIMGLKIYNANDFNVKLKSTIHSTGKLGFTEATAKFMKIEVGAGVKFASDDEDESMLYLMYCKEFEDGAFKVAKSGNYFYVNAKGLFDLLGLDYKKNNIMFDMVEVKELGENVYKLNMRSMPRK